jgi:hypothetical protein
VWILSTSSLFSAKFMYVDMMNGHIVLLRKYVIYQREIDVVARNVCYVILRILLTMFFSCVLLLDLYEELFFSLLTFIHWLM